MGVSGGATALPASCYWVTWGTVVACDLLAKVTGDALNGSQSLQSVTKTLAVPGTCGCCLPCGSPQFSLHTDAAGRAHCPCSDSGMGAPPPRLSALSVLFSFFSTSQSLGGKYCFKTVSPVGCQDMP